MIGIIMGKMLATETMNSVADRLDSLFYVNQ